MNSSVLDLDQSPTSGSVSADTDNTVRSGFNLKSIMTIALELFVVLILVMVFFLLLLRLLNNFFPEGSDIQEIINHSSAAQIAAQLQRNLLVHSNDGTSELAPGGDLVATLTEMNRDVRSKRADSIAWQSANRNMALYNHDAVQTFSRSSAMITFDDKNRLKLGPETLVIIKRMEQDVLFKDKRSSLILVEGELSGSIENHSNTERHVEILTAGASANIRTRDNTASAVEFKVSVNPDQSSTVAILQGSAEIISEGVSQQISENEAVIIHKNAPPSMPKPLPEPVSLRSPADDATSYYRDIPDEIKFSWNRTSARKYRLIISKDPQQKNILLDETVNSNSFSHGNLTQGEYFWRVSGINDDGSEGRMDSQHSLKIVRDQLPPELKVAFPHETLQEKDFILHGSSEPGSKVYINNNQIKIDDQTGEFSYKISLTEGINVILVEAADSAGNIAYHSQLVNVSGDAS